MVSLRGEGTRRGAFRPRGTSRASARSRSSSRELAGSPSCPITASIIASCSDATAASATPSAASICPAASRRRATSRLPSRAGTRTGRSVRSLTQRTSCGRVKSKCAYQSPNFVDGGVGGASCVIRSRFRSLAVHRSVNMPYPRPTTSASATSRIGFTRNEEFTRYGYMAVRPPSTASFAP